MNYDAVFDDDYRYFYETRVPAVQSDLDARVLRDILCLAPDRRALDIGCGDGRLSLRLARAGINVTGLDLSRSMIACAKGHLDREPALSLQFIQGDVRSLESDSPFDAAFSWFTSFGFGAEEENRAVLLAIGRALRPGGLFAIDIVDRAFIERNLQSAMVVEREDCFLIDRLSYDPDLGRLHTHRVVIRDGIRRCDFFVQLLSRAELTDWLRDAGFDQVKPISHPLHDTKVTNARIMLLARKGGT